MIAVASDFRRVVEIKNAIEFRINGENHLARRERFFKERPGRSRLEDVIGHKQQEWIADLLPGFQNRNAIVLVVLKVVHHIYRDTAKPAVGKPLDASRPRRSQRQ